MTTSTAAANAISLFKTGVYNDTVLFENDTQVGIDYCGQRKGGKDHLIRPGAFFFVKENNSREYKLLGKVSSVVFKGIENNINVYTLVIEKEINVTRLFRVKNDICDYFGWPRLNSFEVTHGIIEHK